MATRQDGNVRRATSNTVSAMRRSAERRRCPSCGRKSALSRDHDGYGVHVTYCRWRHCGYAVVRDLTEGGSE